MNLTAKGKILKLIQTLDQGDSFLAEVRPNVATMYANQFKIKISTKRILTIDPKSLESKKVTKITIL